MRDIGGGCTKNNQFIKENRFIRSDLPKKLEDEEISQLLSMEIDTVIDLRKEKDIERERNALNISQFNYFNVSLKGDKCPELEKDIPFGYMEIIDDRDTMNRVFSIILDTKNGILFNCNAGKDRTGVISMLLLFLAEAYEDDIIADYQISYTYLRDMFRKMHVEYPDLPKFLGKSKMEYMEKTISLFKDKYSNIDNYMDYIGIGNKKVNIIRDKLLM